MENGSKDSTFARHKVSPAEQEAVKRNTDCLYSLVSPLTCIKHIPFVLLTCVAGIWSAYITQGVLQETLSTKKFSPDDKRFEHLPFLNLAQNVLGFFWAFIMIKLWSQRSSGSAPWWSYWSASISNTIGPAMGIEALKYISYPAQMMHLQSASRMFQM